MAHGEFGAYDDTRPAILHRLKRNNLIPADAIIPSYIRWEIKWSEEALEIHGPHSWDEMHAWAKAHYFQSGVFTREWQGHYGDEWKFHHGEDFL